MITLDPHIQDLSQISHKHASYCPRAFPATVRAGLSPTRLFPGLKHAVRPVPGWELPSVSCFVPPEPMKRKPRRGELESGSPLVVRASRLPSTPLNGVLPLVTAYFMVAVPPILAPLTGALSCH